MTDASDLCALLEQRHHVWAAHTLVQQIEGAIPLDGAGTFWRGAASAQYHAALQQLYQSVVATRAWLENARTDCNAAIAEAESA